jgi:hypothetical protein
MQFWYIDRGNGQEGPWDEATIATMIRAGQLTRAYVGAVGGAQWIELARHPTFASALSEAANGNVQARALLGAHAPSAGASRAYAGGAASGGPWKCPHWPVPEELAQVLDAVAAGHDPAGSRVFRHSQKKAIGCAVLSIPVCLVALLAGVIGILDGSPTNMLGGLLGVGVGLLTGAFVVTSFISGSRPHPREFLFVSPKYVALTHDGGEVAFCCTGAIQRAYIQRFGVNHLALELQNGNVFKVTGPNLQGEMGDHLQAIRSVLGPHI